MARICVQSARDSSSKYVVDFGAGLGHLARMITYGYEMKVCCLEMQKELNEQAKIIDQQFEQIAKKHLGTDSTDKFHQPIHLTTILSSDVSPDEFLKSIRSALNIKHNDEFSFGIIGLHPCGDLGAILINLFLKCNEAKFLNIIGCCYMKLTINSNENLHGYPLSMFLRNNKCKLHHHLSYESREIACHAIEVYQQRLRDGNYENLKVHSYRAALERILIKYWPQLKHSGLKSVKHTNSLTFEEYSKRAVQHLSIELPNEDLYSQQTLEDLNQWKCVVIYYTLRLMFAPLIESILLYDRLLYLQENGCDATVNPIFDPELSPRNHIMTALKRV